MWLTQAVVDDSDPLYPQCTRYKFVTFPLEQHRVVVPPSPGNVSHAFSSNGAWLSRVLDCTCVQGEKEIRVVTTLDGGLSVVGDEGQQQQQQQLECAIKQQVLEFGICRQASESTAT